MNGPFAESFSKITTRKRLSILIPSVFSRSDSLASLTTRLRKQIGSRHDVEIIALCDDKTMWLGEKRNRLMDMARGEYLTFIDDDDDVPDDWLKRLTIYMDRFPGPDVYSLQGECLWSADDDGVWKRLWYMSTSLQYGDINTIHLYDDPDGETPLPSGKMGSKILTHFPWSWCLWRTSLARTVRFENVSYGEDREWVKGLKKVAKREVIVPEVLYTYFLSKTHTESGVFEPQCRVPIQSGGEVYIGANPGIIDSGKKIVVA